MKFVLARFAIIGSWLRRIFLLGVLCVSVLGASALNGFSLDREAFSFTNYDLQLQVDPAQHRLGVRGRITLRNDTASPQKVAVLQISSSLDWRSISVSDKGGDKAVQFITQTYVSDIDHTGALSEAIVTLPQPVAPQGTIDLDIAYEGVIVLDATRLTRIGTPEDVAKSTDWDQIGGDFTAVRGVGYVAWYPIATESANLSEGSDLFDLVARWKRRETGAELSLMIQSTLDSTILFSGTPNSFVIASDQPIPKAAAFSTFGMDNNVPTFLIANYQKFDVKGISSIYYLRGRESAAQSYANVLGELDPIPSGRGTRRLQVAELPVPSAAPFVTDELLLMPLKWTVTPGDRLTLVYSVARQQIRSPRPWIVEGLAHYAQVLDIERQQGRQAALDYLKGHLGLLAAFEKDKVVSFPGHTEQKEPGGTRSLINMTDDTSMQSKAMWVWWMLRDMVGEVGLNLALFQHDATADKETSYMQKLLEKPAQRDLQWFFDDWVYHDRGLPEFKIDSAFSRKTSADLYLVTITVDNLGTAAAEVPLTVKFAGGTVTKRLEIQAKSKAVIRVETSAAPQEITVNDGSVPESGAMNNVFKFESPTPAAQQ